VPIDIQSSDPKLRNGCAIDIDDYDDTRMIFTVQSSTAER